METISGISAMRRAEAVSRMGGSFSLSFFPYSRKKTNGSTAALKTYERCTMRTPLPHDKFDVDGKHYLLFQTEALEPKSCYRVLVRYIGFSDENFKLKKVIWYE